MRMRFFLILPLLLMFLKETTIIINEGVINVPVPTTDYLNLNKSRVAVFNEPSSEVDCSSFDFKVKDKAFAC